MKKKSLISVTFMSIIIAISFANSVSANEKATVEDVYKLILRAVPIIQELGDEGLKAFNNPKGEFVYKDAYVYVLNCSKMTIAAHPNKRLIGISLKNSRDKNPNPAKIKKHGMEMCRISKKPQGGWIEYYWNILGSKKVARKIGFVIGVPGTPYALTSSIYDSKNDVAKLNSTLK